MSGRTSRPVAELGRGRSVELARKMFYPLVTNKQKDILLLKHNETNILFVGECVNGLLLNTITPNEI